MTGVKVSVVVPTYNCAQGYYDTLRSLRDQSMPRAEYEVIFVDDGSTDDTVTALRGDTAFDSWVRVLTTEHTGGPGRPRNLGIEAARGEFVLFLDDDDWLAPEALERMYDQAVRFDADIVVPRMAGHGRAAPREATATPLERGHITTHPQLLRSMTALKMFRRSLLVEHELRFPEGRVPLEDHIFTLRAHLLARAATVVHDYTCYHWVRVEDGSPAATPPPHQGTGVADLVRSVAYVFGVIRRHVPPGPLSDSLIARWYRVKLLSRFDERILAQSDAAFQTAHSAILDLVREQVPPETDAYLPVNLRVRSAVLRAGAAEPLRTLARHESGTAHVARVEILGWREEGGLGVTLTSDLVRGAEPVRFTADGDRLYWDLPAALLAIPGVAEAADVTDALPATAVRPFVRLREDNTDLYLPVAAGGHRAVTIPLGRSATGRPQFALRVETTASLDAATADHGGPITGLWDLNAVLDTCGWSKTRRFGDNRTPLADAGLRPAFLADGTFVAPYWTKNGNLSVRVDPPGLGALKDATREAGLSYAGEAADGLLYVRLPLELGPLRHPVPLALTLHAGAKNEPVTVPAHIVPNGAPDLAVLQFAVRPDALAGAARWALRAARDGGGSERPAALGVTLHRHAPGQWTIAHS